jgi:hypothetical protein
MSFRDTTGRTSSAISRTLEDSPVVRTDVELFGNVSAASVTVAPPGYGRQLGIWTN